MAEPLTINERQWQKIKEVFALAVEIPQDARAGFLQQVCSSDASVLCELESLLRAHEESSHVIEKKVFDLAANLESNGKNFVGQQFGHYKILREIGRGGMGMVFLADRDDGAFSQKVAVKIVRQSFSDEVLESRFRRERQILASLNHPNVARLFDGGMTPEGLPFLVMEYVEGKPLIEFAESLDLSVEERLRLFLKVCSAVAYAHRNLIVHRDIKPSNIIVTADAEPKLLDFGLAKILDDNLKESEQTRTALRAFTPSYASPEQILGKNITTSSDVFSLGVVLYELLTNQKPFHFENKSLEEILQIIDSTAALKPSRTQDQKFDAGNKNSKSLASNRQLLRGDLDNIVLMALRKEPERRYRTVEQFAQDVEKHLKGLPVAARPNTVGYRTSKFIRRHKAGVAAAFVVFVSLVSGLAVSVWQANVARQQKVVAENRFNDVRQLSNSLLFELSPKIERLPGSTEAREILVKRALEYLDRLAQEAQEDLSLQGELAAAYEKIGDLQGAPRKPNLSDFSGALASYEKALAIRKKLFEKNPADSGNRQGMAANYASLSNIRYWTNDFAGSLRDSESALYLYENLVKEEPDSLLLLLAKAETQFDIAFTYYFNNRIPESYPFSRNALASLEELRIKYPYNAEILRLLGRGYTQLGIALSWDGKQAAGEVEMARALAINESLAAKNPQDSVILQSLMQTYLESSSLYEDTNNSLSLEYLQKARLIAEEAIRTDSANIQAQQNLAKTNSRIGVLLNSQSKFAEAIPTLEKSLGIFTSLEKNEPKNLTYKADISRVFMHLGIAKYNRGDRNNALADYRKAAGTLENIIKSDAKSSTAARNLSIVYDYIGDVYRDFAQKAAGGARQTNIDQARESYRRSLDILQELKAQNSLAEYDNKFLEKMKGKVNSLN